MDRDGCCGQSLRVGIRISGKIIISYNQKTVTVITEGGERWNVAPGLLHRVVEANGGSEQNPNVVSIRKR